MAFRVAAYGTRVSSSRQSASSTDALNQPVAFGRNPVAFGRPLQIKNQLLPSTSSPPKCHIDRKMQLGQLSA